MRIAIVLFPLLLLAGCSAPDSSAPTTDATPAPAAAEQAPVAAPVAPVAPAVESPAAATGSAIGVVESVDASAKTVTIAHEAVESLKWPAMTMTFQAPDIDLSTIKAGDKVSFEVTADGMDGTITSITRQ